MNAPYLGPRTFTPTQVNCVGVQVRDRRFAYCSHVMKPNVDERTTFKLMLQPLDPRSYIYIYCFFHLYMYRNIYIYIVSVCFDCFVYEVCGPFDIICKLVSLLNLLLKYC